MKTIISRWDSPQIHKAVVSLILGVIAGFFCGIFAGVGGDDTGTDKVIGIISSQFLTLIPWALAGFIITLINPIGLTLVFFIAGEYIFLCWKIVLMATPDGIFYELSDFGRLLFAISPPGALIGASGILLLLWHRKFWNSGNSTDNQQLKTNH